MEMLRTYIYTLKNVHVGYQPHQNTVGEKCLKHRNIGESGVFACWVFVVNVRSVGRPPWGAKGAKKGWESRSSLSNHR